MPHLADRRYIYKSLLLRFNTVEAGESRRLLLNLRKGYFKHGDFLGTKIYLSQVHEVILDEVDGLRLDRGGANFDEENGSSSTFEAHRARTVSRPAKMRRRSDRLADEVGRAQARAGPTRWIIAAMRLGQQAGRFLCTCWDDLPEADDGGNDSQLYSVIVHARATSGWKWIMGLTSRSHTVVLDFRRPDERARFIAFVEALLPPSIRVAHAEGAVEGAAEGGMADLPTCGNSSSSGIGGGPDGESASSATGSASTGSAHVLPPLDLPPLHRAGTGTGGPAPACAVAPREPRASAGASARAARTESISVFVGSWNMGDAVAPAALDAWLSKDDTHDVYAIATQECGDEHWMMALDSHLGSSYVRVAERRMGGIALVVFTHRRHATKITGVETSFLPTGVLGVGTNKGAVALAFCLRGVRLCVVNAHLAAHQDKLLQRNKSVQEITRYMRLGVAPLELPLQFHTIWCGDLNYRIDAPRNEVLRLVGGEQWHRLYERDQLAQELAAERVLFGFNEARIAFPPTYKYETLRDAPNKRRAFGKMGLRARPFPPNGKSPTKSEWKGGELGASPSAAAKRETREKGRPSHFGSFVFEERRSSEDETETAVCSCSTDPPAPAQAGAGPGVVDASSASGSVARKYDDEKNRVPSWCDRVLWRSLPGPVALSSTGSTDTDDPHFYNSDHAPVHTVFELELPVLPTDLPLHHCTIYLSNLTLYRARPSRQVNTGMTDPSVLGGSNLTARTAQGKGVPLPVAGAKLQNLPPQLSVYAHMLALHKLMAEPPHHAAALNQDGRGATNIVIGPMLAQREFLALQQLQLRIVSVSGGKLTELGQAVFSLAAAATGTPYDFDVIVERLTVPAGFNLRGTVSVVYTKTLGEDHLHSSGRVEHAPRHINGTCSRRHQPPMLNNLVRGAGAGASASRLVRTGTSGRPSCRASFANESTDALGEAIGSHEA